MAGSELIRVEVAFARPDHQLVVPVEVPEGATVMDAIQYSTILDDFPEIDLDKNRVGIFGKLVKADHVVEPGDRVEIYRPLKADPKEVRRRLAAEGRTMGRKKDEDPADH